MIDLRKYAADTADGEHGRRAEDSGGELEEVKEEGFEVQWDSEEESDEDAEECI